MVSMEPVDAWLNLWLSAVDLKKSGQYRSPGSLHVYTMTDDADGPQFSGQLEEWSDLCARLEGSAIELGLVAVEASTEFGYFKYPGVTLAFEGPFGGSMVASEVMNKLSRLGIGGVLAGAEQGGRFGVLRIMMVPRWYAKNGDELFGLDWTNVPNDPIRCSDEKKAWAVGMHKALRNALSGIPSMCIDTVQFGVYDIVDWLHELGPNETQYLYCAKPTQLSVALSNLGTYDLDALSSKEPRPFEDDEILKTIFDALEEEFTPEWLNKELASPDCIVLHARGRNTRYPYIDVFLLLLRRQSDGRIRLTTVEISPRNVGIREDRFEVNPAILKWPKGKFTNLEGTDAVFRDFIERYGDVCESGILHLASKLMTESAYRNSVIDWFRKSPSAAVVYELLSDADLRTVTPLFRPNFNWNGVEERELTAKEAEELFEWICKDNQRDMEGQLLLHSWQENWKPPGFTRVEVERILRKAGLKMWDGDTSS